MSNTATNETFILGVPKSYIERHARRGETYTAASQRLKQQYLDAVKERKQNGR